MRRKQILMSLTAVLAAGALATAPQPLARWSGDFTQTVKGAITATSSAGVYGARVCAPAIAVR